MSLSGRRILTCVALALVTLAVYYPAVHFGFVNYDDPEYLTENPHVQHGLSWSSVVWAFQTGYAANWHPVTWLSHMLDYQLYGLRPWGHHLTNVLLHAANVLLLFLVLQQMTGALWRSALVAALFALHPLHVESVAWLSERKDLLSTFFGLLAIWAYVRYAQRSKVRSPKSKVQAVSPLLHPSRITFHSSRFYLLSLLLFSVSLMSKPMLVTLPFLLLLLDFWPLNRLQRTTQYSILKTLVPLLREKLPFLILSATSSVITIVAQRAGEAVVPLDHYPFPWRLLYALMGYCGYLQKMVWPSGLNFLYLPHSWPAWRFVLAALMLMGITALALGAARNRPYVTVGWLWYLGSLVPVIGLIQVGNQSMADRYTYLPLVGCFIILVWGGYALLKVGRSHRVMLVALPTVTIIGCILGTTLQLRHWRTSSALFQRAIQCDTSNFVAHTLLGNVLVEQGRFSEADAHYSEALHIRPDHADAYVNRGFALVKQGRPDEAITNYRAALRLKPDYAAAHKNLGAVLAEQGQLDEAILQFAEAVRMNPNDAGAQYNLGTALLSRRRFAEAATSLATSLELKPDDPEAQQNLALALMQQGKHEEAISLLMQIVDRRPDARSHYNLAEALLIQHRSGEAAAHLRAVLALEPDSIPALNNLAWILATHPDPAVRNGPEAVRLAHHACEMSGGTNTLLLGTLAAAYAEAGRFEDAVETTRKIKELALASKDRQAASIAQERITLYESGKPCRQN